MNRRHLVEVERSLVLGPQYIEQQQLVGYVLDGIVKGYRLGTDDGGGHPTAA